MRTVKAAIVVLATVALAGCHVVGHAPPGQLKKVVAPPPGHAKKHKD